MPGSISWEVGAVFIIEDRAGPALNSLSAQFARIEEQIVAVQRGLRTFGENRGIFTPLETGANAVREAIASIGATATEASRVMTGAMASVGTAMNETVAAIGRVTTALMEAQGAATRFGAAGGAGGAMPGFIRPRAELPPVVAPGEPGPAFRLDQDPGFLRERDRIAGAEQSAFDFGPQQYGPRRFAEARPDEAPWRSTPGIGIPPPPVGSIVAAEEGAIAGAAGAAAGRGSRRGGHMGGGLVAAGEAFMVYEMLKQASSEEQALGVGLLRGFNVKPSEAPDKMQTLQDLAHQGVQGTQIAEVEGAKALSALAIKLQVPFEDFIKIAPSALRAAEAAKTGLFGSDPVQSIVAGAEVAHQVQGYSAGEYTKNTEMLSKIARVTGATMSEEARSMSYVLPMAHALGADTEETMLASGFLQRAGLRGTVGSTTLRQLMVAGLKDDKKTAHGRHANREKRELANALGLKEDHFDSEHPAGQASSHHQAMVDLGLLDAKGNRTFLTDGKEDLAKELQTLSVAGGRMSKFDFGRAMFNFAGVRGEQAELIAGNPEAYKDYRKFTMGQTGSEEMLGELGKLTAQQTGQAGARILDLANELGTGITPLLRALDAAVISVTTSLYGMVKENPVGASVALGGVMAGGLWAGWRGLQATLRGVGRGLGLAGSSEFAGSTAGAIVGEAAGAVPSALGAVGRALLGPLGMALAVPGLAELFYHGAQDAKKGPPPHALPSMFYDDQGHMKLPWTPSHTDAVTPRKSGGPMSGSFDVPGVSSGPTNITVTVGPVTMNGVADEGTFRSMLGRLTGAVRDALHTATGVGGGSLSSAYGTGGAPT